MTPPGATPEYLIVDDEPDMCWAMAHILCTFGFSSVSAQRGEDVLTILKKKRFKQVFMDAKLPDIEGLELASSAREIDPAAKIVLVSGYYYRDDLQIQRALAEGTICHFVAKPFTHSDILATIKRD